MKYTKNGSLGNWFWKELILNRGSTEWAYASKKHTKNWYSQAYKYTNEEEIQM